MGKDSSKIKSLISLILVTVFVIMAFFIILPNHKNIYMYFSFIYFLVCLIIGIVFFKINRKKDRMKYDTIQVVIMAAFMYLVIIYLLGIFLGFNRNPISLKITNVLKNLLIYGTIIISQEFLRFNIIKNIKKNKFLLVFTIFIFTVLSLLVTMSGVDFNSKIDLFKFISADLFPNISLNIMLTYIAYKTNYFPNIIYRLMIEFTIYVLPIFPNLGIYIEAIIGLLLPFMIMFKLYAVYIEEDVYERKRVRVVKSSKIVLMILVGVTATLAALVTGTFKCQVLAIVSNSMKPVFQRGDAVFLEKVSEKEIKLVKKGNVVVYNNNGIYVVHRVIDIEKKNNTYIYTFKGDNNDVADDKKVYANQIVGIVKFSIPKVGYPSVWITEQLSK